MKSLYCYLLLLVLFSCQKDVGDDIDVAGNCKLVRMVQGLHDGQADDTTFLFTYDANDRLSAVSWTGEGATMNWNMVYDAQGNLLRTKCAFQPGFLETIFKYDNSNRLTEIHYERFDSVKYIFEYNGADTVPARCQNWYIHFSNGQWTHGSTSEYTIANGNIVKEEVYEGTTLKWTYEFEYYNDLLNKMGDLPLISINTFPLGYYENFYFFNKNMPKAVLDNINSDYHIRYVVDSGRIAESVGAYVTPGTTDTSMKDNRFYYYECK